MLKDDAYLEHYFGQCLKLPLSIIVCNQKLTEALLTPEERSILDKISLPSRRQDFLVGRKALRLLSSKLAEDYCHVAFPSRTRSLTHAAGLVVAAGISHEAASRSGVLGLGIDLERSSRAIRREATRFFLSQRELRTAEKLEPGHLLCLWTTKEALFKADPDNEHTFYCDYVLDDTLATRGKAHTAERGKAWKYCSIKHHQWWLTIAVCFSGKE